MLKKIFNTYQKILDEKLSNSTSLVMLIALLVIWIWNVYSNNENQDYAKASIIEAKTIDDSYIQINWKIYKLID